MKPVFFDFSMWRQKSKEDRLKPVLLKSGVRDGSYSCYSDGGEINARGVGGSECLFDAGADGWAGQIISGEK